MKTKIFALLLAAVSLVGCKKDNEPDPDTINETKVHLDYNAKTWYYYCLEEKKFVGSGTSTDDAAWFARTDWDFAINEYELRSNSGTSTTKGAMGGATRTSATTLAALSSIPSVFTVDTELTSTSHGGATTTTSRLVFDPTYTLEGVIDFQKDADGSAMMPPTYIQAPVYVFRTANGTDHYKVLFTKYTTDVTGDNPEPGIVEFTFLKM